MNKLTNPLDNLKIASPCSQDWNAMAGDNRKRFCGECKLNVYNLSGMTRMEAEDLLIKAEGRLCVRFYQRADGTILTEDCPVGWAAVKRRVIRMATACASLLFGLISGLGLNALFGPETKGVYTTGVMTTPTPKKSAKTTPTPENFVMGDIAMPTPTPKNTPKPKEFKMGEVAARNSARL